MGANTGIAWTDFTFNPWWGCVKVSPGCANCYAESWDARWKGGHWGKDAPRRFFGEAHWREPLQWNEAAKRAGKRARVFCASMADVFEDRRDLDEQRERLWRLIYDTPCLDWQLLTKRPENVLPLVPVSWTLMGFPYRVWIGTTVEDQKRADERIPHLLKVPASVRFLSAEPLLERVDLGRYLSRPCTMCDGTASVPVAGGGAACPRCLHVGQFVDPDQISWVIVGGESGAGARPFDLAWARSIVRQCKAAGVPVFVKQLGEQPEGDAVRFMLGRTVVDGRVMRDRKGGDPAEWPEDLRVREFPVCTYAREREGGDGRAPAQGGGL